MVPRNPSQFPPGAPHPSVQPSPQMHGQPMHGQPMHGQPMYGQPMYGQHGAPGAAQGFAHAPNPAAPHYSAPPHAHAPHAGAPPPYAHVQPAHVPTPTAAPGFFASISLWTKIKFGFAVVALIATSSFYFFITHRNASNIVIFENSLKDTGELFIDGKSHGKLASRKHVAVTLDPGSHEVELRGSSGSLDKGSLDVPKKEQFGYHAVYNLGGQGGIAIVTVYYGKQVAFEDSVKPVPVGTRLMEFPSTSVLKAVDEPFPSSIRTTKNAMSPSVTRLCHVDMEAETVGCPGW